jgi:hypothetical protein
MPGERGLPLKLPRRCVEVQQHGNRLIAELSGVATTTRSID